MGQTSSVTTPPEDDPAEVAEFWRLTQEPLASTRRLTEDPVWDSASWDGPEDD